jgi:hypothetical protein
MTNIKRANAAKTLKPKLSFKVFSKSSLILLLLS